MKQLFDTSHRGAIPSFGSIGRRILPSVSPRGVGVFLFGALVAAATLAADPTPVLHPKATALPSSHQGPFVTTGDGAVLAIDAKNALRSRDEGKTWTATPLFRDPSKYEVSNERVLLRTPDGIIISAWMNLVERQAPKDWGWGKTGVDWHAFVLPTYVCRSLDDGKTWEEPVFLNKPWCGCIHSMIAMRSGRIVLVGQEIIPAWRHATVMFVSDDQGKTWQRSNVLDYGIGTHDHAGSIEGSVIERKDGTLYLLLRTESGSLWEATSRDGLLWEHLQPSKVRSVTCCPQLARLSDGRIALLWNHPPRHAPDSRVSREELSLAFSTDECVTWSAPVVMAANYGGRGRVSYPYLYERMPGELWITTMQGNLRMKINVADVNASQIPIHRPTAALAPSRGGIIMFGDSTTAARPGEVQKVYAERVAESLLGIGSSLAVHNAGIGSNTTENALKRLQADVLAHQPRIVVIQFGLNDAAIDVWRTPPATEPRVPLAKYGQNLRGIVTAVRGGKAIPILMTTNPLRWTPRLKTLYGKSPYRPDEADGFDTPVLARYNEAVRQIADELNVPLIDVHGVFTAHNADKLLLDGMHPNDAGHEIIATEIVSVLRAELQKGASRGARP